MGWSWGEWEARVGWGWACMWLCAGGMRAFAAAPWVSAAERRPQAGGKAHGWYMHSPCRTCSMGVEASPTSGTGWLTLQRELRRKAAPKTCNRAGRAHGNVDEA